MKIIAAILFLVTYLFPAHGQKVRLLGDHSNYVCLNDSLAAIFTEKLKKKKVDSTITILYDFDNGRLSNSRRVLLWTHNGLSYIRLIEGCSKINKDVTRTCDLKNLWGYINVTHFDDVSIPFRSGTGQSHDKCYSININARTQSFFIVVRDNERKSTEKDKNPESDSRVMLTNKIDKLIAETF